MARAPTGAMSASRRRIPDRARRSSPASSSSAADGHRRTFGQAQLVLHRWPRVLLPADRGKDVGCNFGDRPPGRVHLGVCDASLIQGRGQLWCPGKVPREPIRVVAVSVAKAIGQDVGIRSKPNNPDGAVHSPLVVLKVRSLLDHSRQNQTQCPRGSIVRGH